jgi:hypothetical protein
MGSQYLSPRSALICIYHNSITSAALRKSRGRDEAGQHDIDVSYLELLWKQQNGKCYYSGIQMNYSKNEWRISIERLDNSKGYIKGNIALCCIEFNSRSQWTCKKVDEMFDILETAPKHIHHNVQFNKKVRKAKYDKVDSKSEDDRLLYRCTLCKVFKERDEFGLSIPNGCKRCVVKRKQMSLETPRGKLMTLLSSARNSTDLRNKKGRQQDFTINFNDLIEIYNEQNGLCAYSGIPLQFGSYLHKDWVVSLERIDPTQGYTRDNVCLICIEFNSSDQTVKTGSDYGSAGWTPLKFQYFLAHVQYKKGLITDEELQAIIDMQVQFKERPHNTRVYTPREYREYVTRTVSLLTQAKRDYGSIYAITSPSGKVFIYQTEVLFQSTSAIFAKIRKYRYKLLTDEITEHGEEAMQIVKLASCKKENLDDLQEYFITSLNTRAPNGLNPKKVVSKKTSEQISNTLINNNIRFGHDDAQLPKYVKFVDWSDRKGYSIVSHPRCKLKYFVSKNKSLEELLGVCVAHLDTLRDT